jgi:hypothetical protein
VVQIFGKSPMELKRICMVVHKNYHNDARVLRYTESLLKCGFQVDVICPPEKHEPTPKIEKGLRVYTIPIHHRPRGRIGCVFEFGLSIVFYCIFLSFLHIKKRYQVIHVHNMPDFLIFSGFLPWVLGTSLILDIHDPMPEFYESKFGERANTLMHRLIVLQLSLIHI